MHSLDAAKTVFFHSIKGMSPAGLDAAKIVFSSPQFIEAGLKVGLDEPQSPAPMRPKPYFYIPKILRGRP